MAGTSVQFVGINEVMKAYDNKDCVKWSVCQGKALNFHYSGDDKDESREDLNKWLKMIGSRTNQAIYTLKFYEDHRGKINAGTPEDCSFNFRIYDPEEDYAPARIGNGPAGNRNTGVELILEEFKEMRKEVNLLREEVKKPAQIGNAEEPLETWEKILDHPITMAAIGKIFGLDVGSMMALDGKISGIGADENINDIVQELWAYDKRLNEHLYKLLQIAKTNPNNFALLLGMLDKM